MIDPLLTTKFEDEILDLIDNQDKFTRGDIQSKVTVLVNKIMQGGYKILTEEEKKK